MPVEDTCSLGGMNGTKQVGILLFYLLLTLLMTYPLAAHLDAVLGPPGDNFEYLYKLWWFKHALFEQGISPFFNPNVFYPEGYFLALHEMSLANISLGMPVALLAGETTAYNALLLLSFVLSGFGAYLLVFRLTKDRLGGLLSGIIYAFCSYRMAHLGAGHLNLLGSQWLPFFFLALERVLESRSLRSAALAGVFGAASVLSSWYYAPIYLVVAIAYVLWRARPWSVRLFDGRLWQSLAAALAVALVLTAPSLMQTVGEWRQREMAFSLQEVDIFSASVTDLFVPNPMHPLWGREVASYYQERQDVPEYMISLSWVAVVLGVFALWPLRTRAPFALDANTAWLRRERIPSTYAMLLLLSVVLALGTTLHVGGERVYLTVPAWMEKAFTAVMGVLANRLALHPMPTYYDLRLERAIYLPLPTLLLYLYLPFFDAMRVWTRFGLIAAFATSILAGIGLARVMKGASRLSRPAKSGERCSLLAVSIGALCVLAAVFELMAAPYALGWSEVKEQPIDNWLAQQTGGGALAEFPLWKAEHGLALYATAYHSRPVVYGYGAFFPRSYRQVRPVLWSFPSAEALALLRKWGVSLVLVGANSYGAEWPALEQRISQSHQLRLVNIVDEQPVYHSGWMAEMLPDFGRAFVVDRSYVYELKSIPGSD